MTATDLTSREQAFWLALLETAHLVDRRLEQRLRAEVDLTQAQFEILLRLREAPCQRLRMTELAEQVIRTKSGLTYQVTKLASAGLVQRASCESDDRGVWAILTPAGRDRLEAAEPCVSAVIRHSLLGPLTSEQVCTLATIFGQVRDHLRTAPPRGPSAVPPPYSNLAG